MVNRAKLILPVISFFGAVYGIFHYFKSVEENVCDMTYMFEYPEYLKIPLKYNSSVKFSRYNLFAYAEGKYVEDLSAQRYRGAPVLFIPGNAGSHRQVRSLASVALRMSQSRQTTLQFNFFSIDFNEEMSALYGGSLNEQMEFVFECIKHIQGLYSVKKKLILIGHSMGGVIAKAVFSLPDFKPSDVHLILTLASPHRKPVISLDSDIVALYERINHAWRYRMRAELKNIPIISIGGGQRDLQVRSDLIGNNFKHTSSLDFHVVTSSIPGVWLSTDHLAIVWCKQLVLTICRSLFDVSNLQHDEAETDLSVLERILKFHYISKSSVSNSLPSWFLPVHSFSSSGQWIEQESNPWRFSRSKVLSTIYLLIPISQSGSIVIIASGLVKSDWIFGCSVLTNTTVKSCAEGENLSNQGEIIPHRKAGADRRIVNLKVHELKQKGYTSLVVYIAPVNSQVEVLLEAYSETDRLKHYNLPPFSLGPHRVFMVSLVDPIVYYNVTILKGVGVFQTVEFQLETRLCRAGSTVGQGLIKMHIPWSGEISYHHIRTTLGSTTVIPVVLNSLPPIQEVNPVINIEFIFDPECSVVLFAKFPFYLMASQFMKFYGTGIVGYAVAFILVLLSDHMNSEGTSSTVYRLFEKVSSFFILVILPSFLNYLLWISKSSIPFFSKPDMMNDTHELAVRTILYFIACGFVLCVYVCVEILLKVISLTVIHWKCKSILETTRTPLEQMAKERVQMSKRTLVCSSLIAAVCMGISSSVATVIASVYHFLKLSSMHTRCQLEENRRGSSATTRKWHFHSLLVLLWLAVLLLTCPGLFMWWKNLKFSLRPSRDVYVLPCTLMVISSAVLWQLTFFHRFKFELVALFIKSTALVTTLYGITSMYRLLYYIAVTFSIICIQQVFGYFKGFTSVKYD